MVQNEKSVVTMMGGMIKSKVNDFYDIVFDDESKW